MFGNSWSDDESQWVIWNSALGIVDVVALGVIETGRNGRQAWLDEPYDMVGPFDLDALEQRGHISFAACVVMSRQRWQQDQVELRRESLQQRRAAQERQFEYQRSRQQQQFQPADTYRHNDRIHRQSLNLPADGDLKRADIKAAFRRLAQKFHPDAGGSHEQFVRITEARNALLERVAS